MIKGIGVDGYESAPIELPPRVDPVTRGTTEDLDRLKKEVAIIYPVAPELRKYPWGREAFFRSKTGGMYPKRLLVAYSVDAAKRIVRGWYLTEFDQHTPSWYSDNRSCPCEGAWLSTIAPGKPSEPAWLYLKPKLYQIEIDQNGEWTILWSNKSWASYQEAWTYAMTKVPELAKAARKDVYLRVVPDPFYPYPTFHGPIHATETPNVSTN
jgi:hypothetical protein